jgi:hypothetical protein
VSFPLRRGPGRGPILIEADVSGPLRTSPASLILDTGATRTLLNARLLRYVGYDPSASKDFAQFTAGTGSAIVPRLVLNRLTALGRHAIGLKVLAHDLSPTACVDGLLGLDFFDGLALTLDFRAGQIDLA